MPLTVSYVGRARIGGSLIGPLAAPPAPVFTIDTYIVAIDSFKRYIGTHTLFAPAVGAVRYQGSGQKRWTFIDKGRGFHP